MRLLRLGALLIGLAASQRTAVDHNEDSDHHWSKGTEMIVDKCACDWANSIADKRIRNSEALPYYCMMPSSKPVGATEFLCQDVLMSGGKMRCRDAKDKGDYLCRNTSFCLAQGGWGNAASGDTATMPCGAGFSGDQERMCMGGKWGDVDRGNCVRTGKVYCGRGSRDANCECTDPQVKYTSMWGSNETFESGFKYSGYGTFTGMKPSDYVDAFDLANWDGQGAGDMVYYCAAPNRGPKCGPESGSYSNCGCSAGEVKRPRNSRTDGVEEEYECVPIQNADACGSAAQLECSGVYEDRDVDCLEYEGRRVDPGMGKEYGLEGKFCREENGVELFFKVMQGEADCTVNDKCAAECAASAPAPRRLLRAADEVGQPIHDELDYIGEHRNVARRILVGVSGADDYCVAVNTNFALRCRDLDNNTCYGAKQCVARDQNDADAESVCNRVNEGACASYTNPRFGANFCEIVDEHACSWHHEDETHFREYCRTKDHWFRPDVPCRSRRSMNDCDQGGHCEWVTEQDATDPLAQLNDLDRCSRYDNFESLCNTINSCLFECNYDTGVNPLVIRGQPSGSAHPHGRCQGHLKSQTGTCRLFDNDADCNNEPSGACFWNYLGNCRCRSGDRAAQPSANPSMVPVPAPSMPAGPSAACQACMDTYTSMGGDMTCELHRPRFECVPAADVPGACVGGSGKGTACTAWTDNAAACTMCPSQGGNDFFSTDLPDTKVGARGYAFCENGRGLLSARCLPNGKFGQTSGACVEVSCPGQSGTNWGRAAADGEWVYADCENQGEDGFMKRRCMANGEWGPIENECAAKPPIMCGISKDLYGVWPDTPAGTRLEMACSNGYHGKRVRVCSTDGHWGPSTGDCFKACYDVTAPSDVDPRRAATATNASPELVFRDLPSFDVQIRDQQNTVDPANPVFLTTVRATCYDTYGIPSTASFVLGLMNDPQKLILCADNPIAREMCPEVCEVDTAECRADCRDVTDRNPTTETAARSDVDFTGPGLGPESSLGQFPVIGNYNGMKAYFVGVDSNDDLQIGQDFPFMDPGRGVYLQLSCRTIREVDVWVARRDEVCATQEARAHCPVSCNACGRGCMDSPDPFVFRGEEHFCHEARDLQQKDDFCHFNIPRQACPDTCGLFCASADMGSSAGNADCPTSDTNYTFSFFGQVIKPGVNPGLPTGTTCAAIEGGIISLISQATPPAQEIVLCSMTLGSVPPADEAHYLAGNPLPGEACLAECNKIDPAQFACTPTCTPVPVGTWVTVDYQQERVAGQVSSAGDDANGCKATVQILGDANNEVEYANKSLDKQVDMCACSNRVDDNSPLACIEGGFCSRHTNGKCFPGETLCYT